MPRGRPPKEKTEVEQPKEEVKDTVNSIPQPIDELPKESEPQTFDALAKSGFEIPGQVFQDKVTKKVIVRWSYRIVGNAAEVFAGSEFVRAYTQREHGDDYEKLAQQLVDKKNARIS